MTIKELEIAIETNATLSYNLQMYGDIRGERKEALVNISHDIGRYLYVNGDDSIEEVFFIITKLNDEIFFHVMSALRNYYSSFLYRYLSHLKKIAYVG